MLWYQLLEGDPWSGDKLQFLFVKFFKRCMGIGRWFENVDVALPDSISSKEVEFEKILSIKVDVLEILVGKNIRGNKKLSNKGYQ